MKTKEKEMLEEYEERESTTQMSQPYDKYTLRHKLRGNNYREAASVSLRKIRNTLGSGYGTGAVLKIF